MKRYSAEERYQNDPQFHALVDMIQHELERGTFTPTELREAVIIAATKYEMRHLRHFVYGPDLTIIKERFGGVEKKEGER